MYQVVKLAWQVLFSELLVILRHLPRAREHGECMGRDHHHEEESVHYSRHYCPESAWFGFIWQIFLSLMVLNGPDAIDQRQCIHVEKKDVG